MDPIAEHHNQGPGVSEILRITIGQEADYYLQLMRELEPDRFAVIKVGGEAIEQELDSLTSDIAVLANLGLYPVIIHGGNPQINADLQARGIETKKHNGIRITDEDTLRSVETGLGQANQALVEALAEKGVQATSVVGGVFSAGYKDKEALGFVGEVEQVNTEAIRQAIREKKIPIVSCIGQDETGQPLNINGDTAAQALGATMQPSKFIMLTSTPGVLGRDGQLLNVINDTQEVKKLIDDGTISEGMIPKVEAGMKVLHKLPAESSVVITDPAQLMKELFTHQGGGTLLRHGDAITHLPSISAVDQDAVRSLIETAFNKRLVDDYFDTLPEDTEVFITDRGYRGIAIVIPGKEGEPAYLDKLVVRPEEAGHGIGDEIVDKVLQEHPEGVFWRVRKNNKSLPWYRSRGRGQEYDWSDDEWIIFFTREVKPDDRAQFAAQAVLRAETVLPFGTK